MKFKNIHFFKFKDSYYAYDFIHSIIYSLNELSYKMFNEFVKTGSISENNYKEKYNIDNVSKIKKALMVINNKRLLLNEEFSIELPKNENLQIVSMTLFLTKACNLSCVYCYEEKNNFKSMNRETLYKALEFLKISSDDNNINISFFGGEPLLSEDLIISAIEICKELDIYNRCRFSITTNGTILNERLKNLLDNYNIGIALSLDGIDKYNDINRPFKDGRGSFSYIDKNIKNYFKNISDRVLIRSTISKNNINIMDIYKYIITNNLKFLTLNIASTDNKINKLSSTDYDKLIYSSEELLNRFIEDLLVNKISIYPNIFTTTMKEIYFTNRKSSYCGISSSAIAVDINGDLYACHRFVGQTDFKIGSIYDFDRETLFENRKKYKFYNKSCTSCWAKIICKGGCSHENYIFNQTSDIELLCNLRRRWIELSLITYAEICEKNPYLLNEFVGKDAFKNEGIRLVSIK